jgi:PKD repeat protein
MSQVAVHNRSKTRAALLHPAALFVLLMLIAVRAFAGSLTLAWDPVNSASLAGYMLYYGPSAGNYTTKIDVGNTTSRAVSNLTDGATYHFVVTAYDASRVESDRSNDVVATLPSAPAAGPVAGFTASSTSGVAPLALNFTSTSTGSITGYAWTFGDGTTSNSQNPSHVYSAAGIYTVALTVTGSSGSNTKTMPNYVTVKSSTSGDTIAPTAPSALTASASGSTSIDLAWKASTDNIGITGYRVERCQGAGCTSFTQIATATATKFVDAGLAAATKYSYRVRAIDAASNLGAYSNTATVTLASSSTGALSGGIATSSAPVNLTTTGTSDWARWPSYIHSATGGGQIRNVAMIGGGSPKTYNGDARVVTWSNGIPTPTGSSTTGVMVSGSGKGLSLTAPADTTTRTLKIYLGAQNTTVTATARLSDGSAPDYVATFSGGKVRQSGVLTLQYRAASGGRTMTVQLMQSGGGRGNVSLQGAALAVVGTSDGSDDGSTGGSAGGSTTTACPCSLWSASAVPAVVAGADTSAVELGIRFKSDVAGYITAIRFYKASTNTGTHAGSLWSAGGTLLARATFTNETANGWQQATFSRPVPIAANTIYVASYHTNVGNYAFDESFFSAAGIDNGPLHAPSSGAVGGNGVYVYSATPAFPKATYNASNYWVDVVMTPAH